MSALASPDSIPKVSLPGIDTLRSLSPPLPHSTNSSKRKADDADLDHHNHHHHHRRPFPRTSNGSPDHSESPREGPCEHCGEIVSFRHRETGKFTTEYWYAHLNYCPKSREQITFSMVQNSDRNQTGAKRRRAKRTQEERIAYLRDDPYVAEFEAYRVLCASCNKWIRLRPNSTYCSIPWDAHRKSCLARKLPKNSSSVEERNDTLSRDPDVLKFDSQRALCRICSHWIEIAQDDNIQAIQTWLQHRSACRAALTRKSSTTYQSTSHPHPPHSAPPPGGDTRDTPDNGPNFFSRPGSSGVSHTSGRSSTSPRNAIILPPLDPKYIAPTRRSPPVHQGNGSSPSRSPSAGSTHSSGHQHHASTAVGAQPLSAGGVPTSATWDPRQEQRHRNASQRAENLRADPLIDAVEPNKVLCKMCSKWVNLRQDSPYCAHPWVQHREKCLIRSERRGKPMNGSSTVPPQSASLPFGGGEENIYPGSTTHTPDSAYDAPVYHTNHTSNHNHGQHNAYNHQQKQTLSMLDGGYPTSTVAVTSSIRARPADSVSPSSGRQPRSRGGRRGSHLLDLASLHGRTNFVLSSIHHLFQSSYGPGDLLSISALLTYLNAAMPPDKFEDFDTPEVARIASTLQLKDRIVLEGDNLRPLTEVA